MLAQTEDLRVLSYFTHYTSIIQELASPENTSWMSNMSTYKTIEQVGNNRYTTVYVSPEYQQMLNQFKEVYPLYTTIQCPGKRTLTITYEDTKEALVWPNQRLIGLPVAILEEVGFKCPDLIQRLRMMGHPIVSLEHHKHKYRHLGVLESVIDFKLDDRTESLFFTNLAPPNVESLSQNLDPIEKPHPIVPFQRGQHLKHPVDSLLIRNGYTPVGKPPRLHERPFSIENTVVNPHLTVRDTPSYRKFYRTCATLMAYVLESLYDEFSMTVDPYGDGHINFVASGPDSAFTVNIPITHPKAKLLGLDLRYISKTIREFFPKEDKASITLCKTFDDNLILTQMVGNTVIGVCYLNIPMTVLTGLGSVIESISFDDISNSCMYPENQHTYVMR